MSFTIDREKFKTEKGKQLYDMLKKIWADDEWICGVIIELKGDEKKQKMIDILEDGETDRSQIVLIAMDIRNGEI